MLGREIRGSMACCLFAAACLLLAPIARAADGDPDTSQRVRELEKENTEIRAELEHQRAVLDQLTKGSSQDAEAAAKPAPVEAEDGLFVVKSKFPIVISGFLKGDLLWNAPRLNSTSAPRYALSETDHNSDAQFTGTIQHSRIQADIGKIDLGNETTGMGHVELDLLNLSDLGDTNFNNNQLRVRQLFASVTHESWTFLVGQAWDLFSPLNPSSLNTNGNYWFGGNAGFRRPQLRAVDALKLGDGTLRLAGSVNANIGVTVMDNGRTLNSGRDSGIPVFEGSAEYGFPCLSAGDARLGVSGLWGQEDVDGVKHGIDQWAIGAHGVLPLTKWASIKGEYQHGENTDAFLTGGGIDTATGDTVGSDSGWVQATFLPAKRVTVNLTFGVDDLVRSDVAPGALKFNLVTGGNVLFKIFEPLTVGLEYTHFDSHYRAGPDESANMIWTSAILSF